MAVTYNVKHPESLVEVAALRRNVHSRRLGPGIRVRFTRGEISRHLVLLEMPDPNSLSFYLQRDNLVLVVEWLVECARLGIEATALRRGAVRRPVAVGGLLGYQIAFLDVDRALLGRVEGVRVSRLQIDILKDIDLGISLGGLALVDPEGRPHSTTSDGDMCEVGYQQTVVEVAPALKPYALASSASRAVLVGRINTESNFAIHNLG